MVRKLSESNENFNTNSKRLTLRIPSELYNKLIQTQFDEGISTLNKLVINIFLDYYDPKIQPNDVNLSEFHNLLTEQRQYFDDLAQLMKTNLNAASESEIKSLEVHQDRILKLLSKNPMKFEDICIILQDMNEFQVFLLLSHLYDKNRLMYNEKREYYAV
jgi:hypothetical protein